MRHAIPDSHSLPQLNDQLLSVDKRNSSFAQSYVANDHENLRSFDNPIRNNMMIDTRS
jgi:hypothetical protein